MENKINRITAAVLSAAVIAALVLTAVRAAGGKAADEPDAVSFPRPSLSSVVNGEFGRDLGEYFAEHFAGRDMWLGMKAHLEAGVGESIVNGIYISDQRLVDTHTSLRRVELTNADPVNSFASEYDGAVYFVAVPTSAGVYGSTLPEHLANNHEKQQIDRFYEELGSRVRKIDAYNILKPISDNYIYCRSDSKWTSYGAYCVYKTVIQKLVFQPIAYDKYSIRHVFSDYRGDLYDRTRYMKCPGDVLDIYDYSSGAEVLSCLKYDNDGSYHAASVYDLEAAGNGDKYDLYLGKDAPLMKIRTSVSNSRKLLVIKDSFADCFIPFLLQHYSEIAIVSPEYMEGRLKDHIDPDKYEQTLFLFGIDSLSQKGILDLLY